MAKKVLVIEDDAHIADLLRLYLEKDGFEVYHAPDGGKGISEFERISPDLVLLDIMLPGTDGLEILKKLRANPKYKKLPIIMLTAKSTEYDKVIGFDLGADDYITKPFNPLEVIARIKAQLRRYAYFGGMEKKEDTISVGGLELDDNGKTVSLNGETLPLTPTEYEIMKLFIKNPGKVFSSKEIYSAVWSSDPLGAEGTIAVHIRHLREKIEIDPATPRYLKVVWGKGYKLEGGK